MYRGGSLDQLIVRYQELPIATRGLISCVVGAALVWYMFVSDEHAQQIQALSSATSERDSMQQQFNIIKSKVDSTQKEKLLEQEKKLQDNLVAIQGRVMESFSIENIIGHIHSAAQRSDVKLASFTPQSPKSASSEAQYYELDINLKLSGNFMQTGSFFNYLSNFKYMVHIKDLSLKQARNTDIPLENTSSVSSKDGKDSKPTRNDMRKRLKNILSRYIIQSDTRIVFYSRSDAM